MLHFKISSFSSPTSQKKPGSQIPLPTPSQKKSKPNQNKQTRDTDTDVVKYESEKQTFARDPSKYHCSEERPLHILDPDRCPPQTRGHGGNAQPQPQAPRVSEASRRCLTSVLPSHLHPAFSHSLVNGQRKRHLSGRQGCGQPTIRISFRLVTHSVHLRVAGCSFPRRSGLSPGPLTPWPPVNHQACQAPSRQGPGWAQGD